MPPNAAPLQVGGQAVIEGVMMRSPHSFVVACRHPDGSLVVRRSRWRSLWTRLKPLRLPLLRGMIVFVESLHNGMSALSFSATIASEALDQPEVDAAKADAGGADAGKVDTKGNDLEKSADEGNTKDVAPAAVLPDNKEGGGAAIWLTVAISIIFAMALFKGLPHLLALLVGHLTGIQVDGGRSLQFHALDGVIKMLILLAYLGAISRMQDVKRLFMYHGAEHKAIHTHEQGQPLTLENAKTQSRLHARCGTAFLLVVLLVSILVFTLVFPWMPIFSDKGWLNSLAYMGIKMVLLLPISGLSYELIRFSSRHIHHPVIGKVAYPGLALQRITTKEPTDDMLETALVALRHTLWWEGQHSSSCPTIKELRPQPETGCAQVDIFASYEEALAQLVVDCTDQKVEILS